MDQRFPLLEGKRKKLSLLVLNVKALMRCITPLEPLASHNFFATKWSSNEKIEAVMSK